MQTLWKDFAAAHGDSSVDFSLYIFDDGSNDGSQNLLEIAIPEAKVIKSKRRIEYCASLNRAAEIAIQDGAEWLFFCNADCDGFSDNFLDHLTEAAQLDGLQWVSPTVVDFSGVNLSSLRRGAHFDVPFAIQTEAYLFESATFSLLGGFNEDLVRYGEDIELMQRFLAQGHRAGTSGASTLRHEGSGLSSRQVFVRTHYMIRNALLLNDHLGPADTSDRKRWIKGVLSRKHVGKARPFWYAFSLWILGIATGLCAGAFGLRKKAMFRSTNFTGKSAFRDLLLCLDYPLERYADDHQDNRSRDRQ